MMKNKLKHKLSLFYVLAISKNPALWVTVMVLVTQEPANSHNHKAVGCCGARDHRGSTCSTLGGMGLRVGGKAQGI